MDVLRRRFILKTFHGEGDGRLQTPSSDRKSFRFHQQRDLDSLKTPIISCIISSMTPAEFRDLLELQTDSELLDICLRNEDPPFVCQDRSVAWDRFRDEFVSRLGVSRAEIRVIGSGRLGFSMKPGKNLRRFRDTSDIDVVIVNAALFDELWLALLTTFYPRGAVLDKLPNSWFGPRRNEVYTGWITPLEISFDLRIFGIIAKPLVEIRSRWFNATKLASRHPIRRHETVNARLYRTWPHAELYHLNSLSELRRTLFEEEQV